VTVSDDEAHERARASAEEAARTASEHAKAEAERLKAEMLTGPMSQEVLRQQGLIYGGLILIGVYMVEPFLTAPSLDASATISILAFAVAIPLLAALVMVNRQEAFRGRRTPSVMVTIAQAVAQSAAFVGIVAGFWHITWVAGVTFLVAGLVAVGIHSAGFWRLEQTQEPTSEDRG
jgi:cation transport ATPase